MAYPRTWGWKTQGIRTTLNPSDDPLLFQGSGDAGSGKWMKPSNWRDAAGICCVFLEPLKQIQGYDCPIFPFQFILDRIRILHVSNLVVSIARLVFGDVGHYGVSCHHGKWLGCLDLSSGWIKKGPENGKCKGNYPQIAKHVRKHSEWLHSLAIWHSYGK